jgi:hypothetical protein
MTDQTPAKTDSATQLAATQPDPLLQMLERVMLAPDLPIERINAILDIRERQMSKEAEQAFNIAFAAAMGEMPSVPRTGLNKHTRQKYSTLDDLIVTSRPVLSRHGLSLNWETGKRENGNIWVRAIVRHSQGYSISTEDEGAPDKGAQMNALQGGGSAKTYLKRYTGFALLGLASGDEVEDDGAATGSTPQQTSGNTGQALRDAWRDGVLDSLPENATAQQKARAFADALIAGFGKPRKVQTLEGAWQRRQDIIDQIAADDPIAHSDVCDAFNAAKRALMDPGE